MDEQPSDHQDLSALDERHVRRYLSEVIEVYRQEMQTAGNGHERIAAAQLLEGAIMRYANFLWRDQREELDQLTKAIGSWRSNLPKPFDD